VRAGEIELDVQRRGSGPALLMITGMGGSHRQWGEPFLAELERDFELITYDHRGVGASSPLRGPVSIPELAADALALLDAVGLARAHVLGISMGGMVAQELALGHCERVRTLTLGCTYCGGPGSLLTPETVIRRLVDAIRSRDRERALRTTWEVNVSARFAGDAGAYAAFRRATLEVPVAVRVQVEQMRAVTGHDTSTQLGRLRMPVLVAHGTADEMLPVANAHVIAEHLLSARLELLPGAGHLFYWEQPQQVAALVRSLAAAEIESGAAR
jgi:pimeloyl-ACP methyl ester carboxylesterase